MRVIEHGPLTPFPHAGRHWQCPACRTHVQFEVRERVLYEYPERSYAKRALRHWAGAGHRPPRTVYVLACPVCGAKMHVNMAERAPEVTHAH